MASFDDNVALMEDYTAPSPSPSTLFTAVIDNNKSSKPILEREPSFTDNKTKGLFQGSQDHISSGNGEKRDSLQMRFQLTDEKPNSQGGLGERIAARAGFNAPRLNTENIRSADFSFNPDVRSPCLTISSPGLSPATLLESPVFLSNPLVQPSPTTGKFSFFPSGSDSMPFPPPPDKSKEAIFEDIDASFAFPSVSKSTFFPGAASRLDASAENSLRSQTVESVKPISQNKESFGLKAEFPGSSAEKINGMNFDAANGMAELSLPLDDPQDEEQRWTGDLMAGGALAEDGYNWRKYGQKHVKGSEFPRSYYKCTHPNCPVKKKVERSPEGHITEIIYKGAHNHLKPTPNRRSAIGSSNPMVDIQADIPEQTEPQIGMGGNFVGQSTQGGAAGIPDNTEATSAGASGFNYGNSSGALEVQSGTQFDSGEAVDGSSAFSNDEEEDDHGTHGSISLGDDGEGDESESKRRKLEVYASEMSGATRAIREPRVVVQTTSDVDILDDGYRWRKYGQKVVKGNPNPRSYYKCTAPGCTVRKHVERASHDLRSVITTYEGKHNHDVPAARNNGHGGSGGSATTQQASASTAQTCQPEPRHRLERPGSASASNSSGPFSFHQQQLFGLCPPGFSFGMNQPGLANFGMPRLGFRPGNLPALPVHPYLASQPPGSGLGSVLPKGEPKLDPFPEPSLGLSNSSSIYQQIMNRLPLGQ